MEDNLVDHLGSGFSGFGIRVSIFNFRVLGFEFRASGSEFRIQGFGFRVQGLGFRVPYQSLYAGIFPSMTHPPRVPTAGHTDQFSGTGLSASKLTDLCYGASLSTLESSVSESKQTSSGTKLAHSPKVHPKQTSSGTRENAPTKSMTRPPRAPTASHEKV